jgi:hypothetical protein
VDITTTVQALVREELGRDIPPADELWETACRHTLANRLWRTAELPPDTVVVYDLTREELDFIRRAAGATGRWWP